MSGAEIEKTAERLERAADQGDGSRLAAELHAMCPEDRLAVAKQIRWNKEDDVFDLLPKIDFYDDGDVKYVEQEDEDGTIERRVYDDNTGKLIAKGSRDEGGSERHTYYETGMLQSLYRVNNDGSWLYTEFGPSLNRTRMVRNDGNGYEETVTFDPVSGSETFTTVAGRLVRVKMSSGPDVVTAWDDRGNAHQFPDEPIKSLPPNFKSIPKWRYDQLDKDAGKLLDRYYKDGYVSFGDIADIQKNIARRKDLTEVEKCQLYDLVQEKAMDKNVRIDDRDENPKMVDTWKGNLDPWHAFAPISDKRHTELVNLSPAEASKRIFEFEDSQESSRIKWIIARIVLGRNEGDIHASEGQLVAMRKLRDKGTFADYADEWERQMVRRR